MIALLLVDLLSKLNLLLFIIIRVEFRYARSFFEHLRIYDRLDGLPLVLQDLSVQWQTYEREYRLRRLKVNILCIIDVIFQFCKFLEAALFREAAQDQELARDW